jgi:cation diffusion facilitator CzcD-associated flavoprotein CzcO
MLIDLDLFESTVPPRKRFCIVGAGIAGLVLAQRLARMGFEVNILEDTGAVSNLWGLLYAMGRSTASVSG